VVGAGAGALGSPSASGPASSPPPGPPPSALLDSVRSVIAEAQRLEVLKRLWEQQLVLHGHLKQCYVRMFFDRPPALFQYQVHQLFTRSECLFSLTDPSVGVHAVDLGLSTSYLAATQALMARLLEDCE
jgi:hypothetical protein